MRAISASVVSRENVYTVPWFLSKGFANKIQSNPYGGFTFK
jgi:hypothetical protein